MKGIEVPKFNVYPQPLPNQPDGADTRIEVVWSQGCVQIATTKLQPGARRDQEFVAGSSGDEPAKRAWDGQFVDIDRKQINALIRNLREYRDKAFGRDE